MHQTKLLLLAIVVLLTSFLGPGLAASAEEPVVHVVLFWSRGCLHCRRIRKKTLPRLEKRHGDALQVHSFKVNDSANYELWMSAMESFQVPEEERGVPMLFIGDTVLIGSKEIPERLPGLIEHHLATGGGPYPEIPGLGDTLGLTPTPKEKPASTINVGSERRDGAITGTEDAVVHLLFFQDRLCEECIVVEGKVLTPLKETYGSRLEIERRDVEGSAENYNLLLELERRYGVPHAEMPVIFIGEYALTGEQEAREQLPGLVESYLAAGGVALPDLTPTPTPMTTPSGQAGGPPIHLAYFHQPGCRECDRVQLDLSHLTHRYPQLVIHDFNVQKRAALCEWLGQQAGVPEEKRLTAPAVFVGNEALVGDALNPTRLEALIARHVEAGAEPLWKEWTSSQGQAASSIIERFRAFSFPTVLVAGLVDGLNPCAFATLVFFISYLAFLGREGRDILLAGAAFALGVFLTYLGVGFGVLRFLASLPFLDTVSQWIYGLTAALCLLLALGSLYDWWQARRGRATEMRLRMPSRLRRRVNRAIREGIGAGAFVPMTFVTGIAVSIIELACTGQVYLPTILFVLGVPKLRARAGLYLVAYNLMFISPLVVVFILAYLGTTSRQLGLLIHRHAAKVKLAMAGLFLMLAGWMVLTMV